MKKLIAFLILVTICTTGCKKVSSTETFNNNLELLGSGYLLNKEINIEYDIERENGNNSYLQIKGIIEHENRYHIVINYKDNINNEYKELTDIVIYNKDTYYNTRKLYDWIINDIDLSKYAELININKEYTLVTSDRLECIIEFMEDEADYLQILQIDPYEVFITNLTTAKAFLIEEISEDKIRQEEKYTILDIIVDNEILSNFIYGELDEECNVEIKNRYSQRNKLLDTKVNVNTGDKEISISIEIIDTKERILVPDNVISIDDFLKKIIENYDNQQLE